MSAQAEAAPESRVKFVQSQQRFYADAANEITFEILERFSQAAEATAHSLSREMTEYLKDKGEVALATHAAHVRSVSANIVLLRGGLVPALRIDPENSLFKSQAVNAMCYIKAEFDAMKLFVM